MDSRWFLWIAMLFLWCGLGAAAPADDTPDLDQLVRMYKEFGLPLPPSNAQLVQLEAGSISTGGLFGKTEKLHMVGFVLKSASAEQPTVLLLGTTPYTPHS